MRAVGRIVVMGLALAAAACVSKPEPAPEPVRPTPAPSPTPPPPPPSAPAANWADLPLTPGNWSFGAASGNPTATFAGSGGTHFSMECDRANRRILLVRAGAAGGALTLRTSYGARSLPAAARGTSLAATLSAADPVLDQIAFSRGRFTVEAPATAQLVLPAWPETARVVEECRM